MQETKKQQIENVLCINVLLFILTLILVSCRNNNEVHNIDCEKETENSFFLPKENWEEHKIVIEGKNVYFVLPDYYSDSYIPNSMIISSWAGYIAKHAFYSTKNNQSFFSILVFDEKDTLYNENNLDAYIYLYTTLSVNGVPPAVPLIEKKRDDTGQEYCLIMQSCFDTREEEKELEPIEQNAVWSQFSYVTFFGTMQYVCVLQTRESIGDFSYKEKREIIESIRIEDCK